MPAAAAGAPSAAAPGAALTDAAVQPMRGRFTEGSIVRHVLVMTGTSTVGILALFVVDLLSLLYVARLGDLASTAGVGFATQVLFYPVSVNIGLTIGVTALVSRALGAGRRDQARQLAASGLVCAGVASAAIAMAVMVFARDALQLLGASGRTLSVAEGYLLITLPANVPFAGGMVLSGVLRATGDARRAMNVTLVGGLITGVLDPVLIFGLHLGVTGAAVATVASRFAFLAVGWHGAARVHGLVGRPSLRSLREDARPTLNIALPAVATNLATPVGNSYVLHLFARFGEAAVAATTITDRIVPVAFAALFALTGAVGPILGQNLGAERLDRVRGTMVACFTMTVAYGLAVWALLAALAPSIITLFDPPPEAAHLVTFFFTWGVTAWLFLGLLYVANASFNNLGFPWLSLVFNWGRATLGTVPFATLGTRWAGVEGGQLGVVAGAALFGVIALLAAFTVTGRLRRAPGPL